MVTISLLVLNGSNPTISGLNWTSTSPYLTVRLVTVSVLGICIITATVAGNLLLVVGVKFVRRMREPGNYLFVSLAVADLFVGMLVMPLACIYEARGIWTLGRIVCDLWTYADVMLCTASILHLCAISLDRCWTIRFPLQYAPKRTSRRMTCYMAITWLFAFLVSLPSLCGFPAVLQDRQCNVNPNIYYQVYATLVAFYIPVIIMVTVNCLIYGAVKKLAKRDRVLSKGIAALASATANFGNNLTRATAKPSSNNLDVTLTVCPKTVRSPLLLYSNFTRRLTLTLNPHKPTKAAQEQKAARNLSIIMGAFIVCWFPFFATTLGLTLCMGHCDFVPKWWFSLVLWLGYANSTVNPILVIAYNRDFKVLVQRALARYCCPWFVRIIGLAPPMLSTDHQYYYYSEPVINRAGVDRKASSFV